MWVRGLKLSDEANLLAYQLSHPVWVRGLKHLTRFGLINIDVAPRVGAWIET